MQELHELTDQDLKGLAPEAVAALAQQMLQHLRRQDSEIRFKDAKIEKITFQLARLKAWKFGAKTEAMSAEQRRLFEETVAEDEASLQAQLDDARGASAASPAADAGEHADSKRKPRRQPLPEHLRREEHHHESPTWSAQGEQASASRWFEGFAALHPGCWCRQCCCP